MTRFSFVGLVLLLLAGLPHAFVDAREGLPVQRPDTVPAELINRSEVQWFGLYMFGKKAGYGSIGYEITEVGGVKAVQFGMDLQLDAKSLGGEVSMRMKMREVFAHAAPHPLLLAEHIQTQGEIAGTQRMVRNAEGGYDATVEQAGEKRTIEVQGPIDYRLNDVLATDIWVRTKPAVGATYRSYRLNLDEMKVETQTSTMKNKRTSLAAGVKVSFVEISQRNDEDGETTEVRYSDAGDIISLTVGGMIDVRIEPEAQAKTMGAAEDLFVLGITKLNRPLGAEATQVTGLVLEAEGDLTKWLNGPTAQEATFDSARNVTTIRIGTDNKEVAKPEDIAKSLKSTAKYPSDVESVRVMAQKAVGDATTRVEKVKRLTKFVGEHIKDVFTAAPLSVLDLMKNPEGDCTEHSALFVALARAVGLPAREAGGLMYMGDEIKAMGGHAWAEVEMDGHWVPVDPTFEEPVADAARIHFSEEFDMPSRAALAGKTLVVVSVEIRKSDDAAVETPKTPEPAAK